MENLQAMKVTDLRRELKARGLSMTGNKTELQQRLQEALANGNKNIDAGESAEELNEDEVLADDSLLNDEVKTHDIIEDDILDSKDIENLSNVGNKTKVKTRKLSEKSRISITRNSSLVVPTVPSVTTTSPIVTAQPKIAADAIKKIITVQPSKDTEKLSLRAQRFGVIATETKLKTRVERFGNSLKPANSNGSTKDASIKSSPVAVDVDRLKQRAARFGQAIAPAIKQVEEKEKLLKRKERFGTLIPSSTLSGEEVVDRKKKRLERFMAK